MLSCRSLVFLLCLGLLSPVVAVQKNGGFDWAPDLAEELAMTDCATCRGSLAIILYRDNHVDDVKS